MDYPLPMRTRLKPYHLTRLGLSLLLVGLFYGIIETAPDARGPTTTPDQKTGRTVDAKRNEEEPVKGGKFMAGNVPIGGQAEVVGVVALGNISQLKSNGQPWASQEEVDQYIASTGGANNFEVAAPGAQGNWTEPNGFAVGVPVGDRAVVTLPDDQGVTEGGGTAYREYNRESVYINDGWVFRYDTFQADFTAVCMALEVDVQKVPGFANRYRATATVYKSSSMPDPVFTWAGGTPVTPDQTGAVYDFTTDDAVTVTATANSYAAEGSSGAAPVCSATDSFALCLLNVALAGTEQPTTVTVTANATGGPAPASGAQPAAITYNWEYPGTIVSGQGTATVVVQRPGAGVMALSVYVEQGDCRGSARGNVGSTPSSSGGSGGGGWVPWEPPAGSSGGSSGGGGFSGGYSGPGGSSDTTVTTLTSEPPTSQPPTSSGAPTSSGTTISGGPVTSNPPATSEDPGTGASSGGSSLDPGNSSGAPGGSSGAVLTSGPTTGSLPPSGDVSGGTSAQPGTSYPSGGGWSSGMTDGGPSGGIGTSDDPNATSGGTSVDPGFSGGTSGGGPGSSGVILTSYGPGTTQSGGPVGSSGGSGASSGDGGYNSSGALCIFAPEVGAKPVYISRDCSAPVVRVASPSWAVDARRPVEWVELYREDKPTRYVRLEASGAGYRDEDVTSPAVYRYRLRYCNAAGCSVLTDPLVVSTIGTATAEWLTPNDAPVAGRRRFVAKVTAPAGLAAQNPVRFLYQGQPLPGVRRWASLGGGVYEYSLEVNTEDWEYQGDVELVLQVEDAGGCLSLPVARTWVFSNTLQTASAWHDVLTQAEGGAQATEVMVYGRLLNNRPTQPARQKWYEFGVMSPAPAGYAVDQPAAYYEDLEAREAEWLKFQPLQLLAPLGLTGTGATPSGNSALFRVRIRPKEYVTRLALGGALGVRSMRQISDGVVEVLTHSPAMIYRVTTDGAKLEVDLRDYGAGSAFAAVLEGDQVVAALYDRVMVIDRDPTDATLNATVQANAYQPLRVERAGANQVAFFGTETSQRAYRREGGQVRRVYDMADERLVLTAQRGNRIATVGRTAAGLFRLREMTGGAEPGPVLVEHDQRIRAVYVAGTSGEDGQGTGFAFQYSDQYGRVYEAGREGPVANFDWLPLALGEFKGAASRSRRALGGEDRRLWLEDEATGTYLPRLTLAEPGASIRALERLRVEVVAEQGDPLMGGTPGVAYDVLLAAVEVPGQPAYLLRLQEADYTPGYSYSGTGVHPFGPAITKVKG